MLNISNGWLLKNGNAYPMADVRTAGMWGTGRLIYVTPDGYCGVMLDGETRIDEYPAEHLDIGETASEALVALAA
jgi:hypothetical protein